MEVCLWWSSWRVGRGQWGAVAGLLCCAVLQSGGVVLPFLPLLRVLWRVDVTAPASYPTQPTPPPGHPSPHCRNEGLGDVPNTRTLYERALTATAPEVARPLWDAYLAFEYDVGTLAAAAAVEQRRSEAAAALQEAAAAAAAGAMLDVKAAGAAGGAAAPAHEALQLALLKYQVLGLWPASEVQQLYFERLLGQAPALEVRP